MWRVLLFFFLGLSPLSAQSVVAAAAMSPDSLGRAVERSRVDGVGAGYCGRGVWSVLDAIGYGGGLKSANGQDWELGLSRAGWIPLVCPTPQMAPLGSVLVYLSDLRLRGHNFVGTGGGLWGHVELVAFERGSRVYVSDSARAKPGGTVPFNFTRRAWVPPGVFMRGRQPAEPLVFHRSSFDPARAVRSADELLQQRLGLADSYFQ